MATGEEDGKQKTRWGGVILRRIFGRGLGFCGVLGKSAGLFDDAKLFRDWFAGELVEVDGLALEDAFQGFVHESPVRNCFWKICQR